MCGINIPDESPLDRFWFLIGGKREEEKEEEEEKEREEKKGEEEKKEDEEKKKEEEEEDERPLDRFDPNWWKEGEGGWPPPTSQVSTA